MVTYPRGELRRVTNDFNEYNEVSAAGGEGAIGALRTTVITNLFIADPADGTTRRLTSATSPEHAPFGLEVAADRVLFPAVHDRRLGISTVPFEGGEPRRLTVGPGHAVTAFARGDRVVFQRFDDDGQQHIWCMGIDGVGLKQVTRGGGEELLDVSPDGSMVAFARVDSTKGVWVVSVEGEEAMLLAPDAILNFAAFSRDGKYVVVADLETDANGLVQSVVRILPVSGGADVHRFLQPPQVIDPTQGREGEWTFMGRDDPARNLYAFNAATGASQQLTHFSDGRLTDHVWSSDLHWIAVVRRDDNGENVWVVDANGKSPKQITKFDGQEVFDVEWTRDSKRVVVRAGTLSRDVVLISNF
jgi:Tol biopolymer transport system component